MRRVLHLPHLSGCIIPSASNSRPDWRTVGTVTPIQRANWGSDWNWMSAVTGWGGSEIRGRLVSFMAAPLQERTICSPHATGIQSSHRVISAAHRDKIWGGESFGTPRPTKRRRVFIFSPSTEGGKQRTFHYSQQKIRDQRDETRRRCGEGSSL